MIDADIAILGASKVIDGVPVVQANVPVGDLTEDVESFGEIEFFQCLGIDALPYPADDSGYAEGLIIKGAGGRNAVCGGARETRNQKFIGNMKPGDVTMHACGPSAVSQVFCKREKRQVGMATEDAGGKTLLFMLDGKNKKAQLAVSGAMIEIGEDGSITLVEKGGAGIKLEGGKVYILGELSLPGLNPGMTLVQALPAPQGPGPLTNPLAPVLGVSK